MNEKKPTPKLKDGFTITQRIKSFSFAFQGLRTLWREEHNARVHAFVGSIVILTGFLFQVTNVEWCLIVLAIVLVLAAECFNSALEKLCDLTSVEYHPLIKKVKDFSAAGVLLCALGAAIIGLIVFLPYLIKLLN